MSSALPAPDFDLIHLLSTVETVPLMRREHLRQDIKLALISPAGRTKPLAINFSLQGQKTSATIKRLATGTQYDFYINLGHLPFSLTASSWRRDLMKIIDQLNRKFALEGMNLNLTIDQAKRQAQLHIRQLSTAAPDHKELVTQLVKLTASSHWPLQVLRPLFQQ